MSAASDQLPARSALLRRRDAVGRAAGPLAQVSALAAILLGWQIASDAAGQGILPGPLDTAPVFARLISTGRFVGPLEGSLTRAVLGFAFAYLLGMLYGLAAGRSQRFEHTSSLVFQFALFANTLVVILWGLAILGNTNTWSVVVVTSLAVFPNVGVYLRDVVKTIDADTLAMAQAYRANLPSRIVDVYLPFLAPSMLASARIGFSLSWKIVMLSEVFGFPSGIGWEIRQAYTAYDLSTVIAWLVVFIITLLLVEQLIRVIERRAIRWR